MVNEKRLTLSNEGCELEICSVCVWILIHKLSIMWVQICKTDISKISPQVGFLVQCFIYSDLKHIESHTMRKGSLSPFLDMNSISLSMTTGAWAEWPA